MQCKCSLHLFVFSVCKKVTPATPDGQSTISFYPLLFHNEGIQAIFDKLLCHQVTTRGKCRLEIVHLTHRVYPHTLYCQSFSRINWSHAPRRCIVGLSLQHASVRHILQAIILSFSPTISSHLQTGLPYNDFVCYLQGFWSICLYLCDFLWTNAKLADKRTRNWPICKQLEQSSETQFARQTRKKQAQSRHSVSRKN